VAADPVDKARSLSEKFAGAIKMYEDPGLRVSPTWGAGKAGDEEPTPATYVVSGDGMVRFEHHAGEQGDWPRADEVIARLP
jgi:hypothetical protein